MRSQALGKTTDHVLEISLRHGINLTGIVTALSLGLICVLQTDTMLFDIRTYEWLRDYIWVSELGLSALNCWMIFCTGIIVSIILMLVSCITWKKE